MTFTHQLTLLTSAFAFLTRKEAERYLVFVGAAFIAWGLWRGVGRRHQRLQPASIARKQLVREAINTSIAHNTHHARVRYNFSWYFLFWDRLMGTLDPSYEKRYESGTASPAPMPGRPV